jgi:hypothetical protein
MPQSPCAVSPCWSGRTSKVRPTILRFALDSSLPAFPRPSECHELYAAASFSVPLCWRGGNAGNRERLKRS